MAVQAGESSAQRSEELLEEADRGGKRLQRGLSVQAQHPQDDVHHELGGLHVPAGSALPRQAGARPGVPAVALCSSGSRRG